MSNVLVIVETDAHGPKAAALPGITGDPKAFTQANAPTWKPPALTMLADPCPPLKAPARAP